MWAVWGVRGWVLWTALLALAFSFPLVWAVLGSMGVGRLDSVGVGCFGFVEVACLGFRWFGLFRGKETNAQHHALSKDKSPGMKQLNNIKGTKPTVQKIRKFFLKISNITGGWKRNTCPTPRIEQHESPPP